MSAPAPNGNQQGAIDDKDVQFWTNKVTDFINRPSEVLNSQSPETASSWSNHFCGFLWPIDTCLITWCLPCVTFGKTHHQLHKDANLEGYEAVNTSCLLVCASSFFGIWWVPAVMQRADIRERFNVSGSCLLDIAAVCCCPLCSLVQNNKEVADRAPSHQGNTVGYQANPAGMTYPDAKPAA